LPAIEYADGMPFFVAISSQREQSNLLSGGASRNVNFFVPLKEFPHHASTEM
jgi:hypothetical protein